MCREGVKLGWVGGKATFVCDLFNKYALIVMISY